MLRRGFRKAFDAVFSSGLVCRPVPRGLAAPDGLVAVARTESLGAVGPAGSLGVVGPAESLQFGVESCRFIANRIKRG